MEKKSVIMMGATGAVGNQTLQQLLQMKAVGKITLLGRRDIADLDASFVTQHLIDIFNPQSYRIFVSNHTTAICTLGVGQPSKVSKETFTKVDKRAVLDFAQVCKDAGVLHFELLSSVGISSNSSSFFLRTKGELVDELKTLNFDRLSIFQPSMILTPENRYGISQAIILALWPFISKMMIGALKKYRGIKVEILGKAIANNILRNKSGTEMLTWKNFINLTK